MIMIIIINNIDKAFFSLCQDPNEIFLFTVFSLAGAFTPVSREQRFIASSLDRHYEYGLVCS
jgi:hypothetical protein